MTETTRALRPCGKCGLELNVPGSRFCAECGKLQQESVKQYDRERNTNDPLRRLYKTAGWFRVRLIVLARDIMCRICKTKPAVEADHVERARDVVKKFGLAEFFNPERLQGLCHECHSRKTAREVGFAGAH
jgi:5-methylcytosine-specific restriction endonuclease McrA